LLAGHLRPTSASTAGRHGSHSNSPWRGTPSASRAAKYQSTACAFGPDAEQPDRKTTGTLARFVQAEQKIAIGQPGHRRAPRQTLEINHPIEALLPHPNQRVPQLGPVAWRRPSLSLKQDDSGQIRIVVEQGRKVGFDPPVDLARGKMPFQEPQYRQRLDDITKRTGFENEDFQNDA